MRKKSFAELKRDARRFMEKIERGEDPWAEKKTPTPKIQKSATGKPIPQKVASNAIAVCWARLRAMDVKFHGHFPPTLEMLEALALKCEDSAAAFYSSTGRGAERAVVVAKAILDAGLPVAGGNVATPEGRVKVRALLDQR